jgi:gluconate 2-dehydrogenase gamma chain
MGNSLGRRDFCLGSATALLAATTAGGEEKAATAHVAALPPHTVPPEEVRLFLTDAEAALVRAVVEVMLPADDVGPSGVEAGVLAYLDRQLAGGWGNGERLYLAGPWAEGTPAQGYQLPLNPAQLFRLGLPELDRRARDATGKGLAELEPGRRNGLLMGWTVGEPGMARTFIAILHAAVVEGYFSDPAHGGNNGMAAWRMIGFPGARGGYAEDMDTYRGQPFPGDPVALADLQ